MAEGGKPNPTNRATKMMLRSRNCKRLRCNQYNNTIDLLTEQFIEVFTNEVENNFELLNNLSGWLVMTRLEFNSFVAIGRSSSGE
jgi:hypothetical protein